MQLDDWAAAVDYARTLPGVDPARIALWGTSFAGGHVIATAARLPGIAAAVAQCPFTDGIASARTITNPLITARITARAVRDVLASKRGGPPVMVATAGRPGEVALMNTTDAYEGYLRLVPDGADVRNEVAARIALQVFTYRPGRLTPKIGCPILFCVCEADSVAPAATTLRHAARAPAARSSCIPRAISRSTSTTRSSGWSPTSSRSSTSTYGLRAPAARSCGSPRRGSVRAAAPC